MLLWLVRRYGDRRLHRRLDGLTKKEPKPIELAETPTLAEEEEALQNTQRYNQIQNQKNRVKFRYDTVQKGINLGVISIWIGLFPLILSFFPQTRAFQVLVLTNFLIKGLEIVVCIFGIYLFIRLSFLVIDYAFSLLRTGQILSPHRPVRSLLRLNTLAGYLLSLIHI